MAIRQIRVIGDEILTKACKPVKEMNERTEELIEDMFETMYENNGCSPPGRDPQAYRGH